MDRSRGLAPYVYFFWAAFPASWTAFVAELENSRACSPRAFHLAAQIGLLQLHHVLNVVGLYKLLCELEGCVDMLFRIGQRLLVDVGSIRLHGVGTVFNICDGLCAWRP